MFTPNVSVFSVISTCWIGVSVLTMRRGFWSFFRGWNLRTVSPLGVNRCSTLSTPLQITPPQWMVTVTSAVRLFFLLSSPKGTEIKFIMLAFLLVVPTIVAYLKEVESPYEVHDFIRIYLGDTIEAKEFAKQFLERRAKQKANHQRQQQQVCEWWFFLFNVCSLLHTGWVFNVLKLSTAVQGSLWIEHELPPAGRLHTVLLDLLFYWKTCYNISIFSFHFVLVHCLKFLFFLLTVNVPGSSHE